MFDKGSEKCLWDTQALINIAVIATLIRKARLRLQPGYARCSEPAP